METSLSALAAAVLEETEASSNGRRDYIRYLAIKQGVRLNVQMPGR